MDGKEAAILDSHSILKRLKNSFCQCFNVKVAQDTGQAEIYSKQLANATWDYRLLDSDYC